MSRSGELRPPIADPPNDTSHYGPSFAIGCILGGAGIAFGLVSLLTHPGSTKPANFGVFFIGLALVHDLVLVPIALAVAWLLRRGSPGIARGSILGAVAVSAILTAFALPGIGGWGAQADNPSFLPRNYAFGLVVSLTVVWSVVALIVVLRARRASRSAR